jgi:hypothetical protein
MKESTIAAEPVRIDRVPATNRVRLRARAPDGLGCSDYFIRDLLRGRLPAQLIKHVVERGLDIRGSAGFCLPR